MPKIFKHDGCANPCFGGGYCKYHQYLRSDSSKKASKNTRQGTKPNIFSGKKIRENEMYKNSREAYLREHPLCEARINFDCLRQASEIHHRRGRGKYFLDISTWLAICP